jgi:hypothetical protein
MPYAICWMIHQSWRASHGEATTGRANTAVGVGERPGLSAKAEAAQHRRGERRLGQMDDEVIKCRQRLVHMVQVRVGHRRILAIDAYPFDLLGVDRTHDLQDSVTTLTANPGASR